MVFSDARVVPVHVLRSMVQPEHADIFVSNADIFGSGMSDRISCFEEESDDTGALAIIAKS